MKVLFSHSAGVFVFEGKTLVQSYLHDGRTSYNDLLSKAKQAFPGAKADLLTAEQFQELRKAVPAQLLIDLAIVKARQEIIASVKKDILIIQAVKTYGENVKVLSIMLKRLRDWYDFTLPELSRKLHDNDAFVNAILTKTREQLLADCKTLETDSLGAPLSKKDMEPLLDTARTMQVIKAQQEQLLTYIETLMQEYCPNMFAITGALIGAQLLELAGDLRRLTRMPASTVQTLGAEKALFRHVSFHSLPPKHGILFQHPLVQKNIDKGKAARALAGKIVLAARVDYFGGSTYEGYSMKEHLDERFAR